MCACLYRCGSTMGTGVRSPDRLSRRARWISRRPRRMRAIGSSTWGRVAVADSPPMRLRLASQPRGARRAAELAGALAAAALAAGSPVRADEPIVVTSCPGEERIAVTFKVDCSHVRDPAARAQCRPFIENQACKVFPAYRRITGINLEKPCPEIVYTI